MRVIPVRLFRSGWVKIPKAFAYFVGFSGEDRKKAAGAPNGFFLSYLLIQVCHLPCLHVDDPLADIGHMVGNSLQVLRHQQKMSGL